MPEAVTLTRTWSPVRSGRVVSDSWIPLGVPLYTLKVGIVVDGPRSSWVGRKELPTVHVSFGRSNARGLRDLYSKPWREDPRYWSTNGNIHVSFYGPACGVPPTVPWCG